MSAADIDDKLGPKGELERLMDEHDDLRKYLEKPHYLARATIPFGAGISEDGATVYVDRGLKTVIHGVNVIGALATHERVEWGLRKFCGIGEDYSKEPEGHRLANRAEKEFVERLGVDWGKYCDFMDPQLERIEHEKIRRIPKNLALYPYEHSPLYNKLLEATGRSRR